jgi:predicted transposase YdaD
VGTHDALFKHAFSNPEHARGVLATALPSEVAARIDFASLVPQPTTFVDATLEDRHADLLFSARIAGREGLLYLLWEHKSEPDHLTPLQVLRYMVRIWDHHLAVLAEEQKERPRKVPVIVVVVLHHGPGGWTAASLLAPTPRYSRTRSGSSFRARRRR